MTEVLIKNQRKLDSVTLSADNRIKKSLSSENMNTFQAILRNQIVNGEISNAMYYVFIYI